MATQGDVLDRLWLEVINLDADGRWMKDCLREAKVARSPFTGAAAALERLRIDGAAKIELGRLGRFMRYECCFGTLEALEDSGPKKGKITGLYKRLQSSDPREPKTWKPKEKLLGALWQIIDHRDRGGWLRGPARKAGQGPFEDTGAAIQSLLKHGASVEDLAQVGAWHRYFACSRTLQILENAGFSEAEEVMGFAELLLGADPSGKEGRPSSWPIKRTKQTKGEGPLWQTRSGQAIAFSPDGRLLAVGAASGPVRVYDVRTGKERLTCEGLKSHIYRVAFSPDGNRLAIAEMYQHLQVCDARTGKVVWKQRFEDNEVSGLAYSVKTGELIRSSWCRVIDVLDPDTGSKKEPLRPAASTRMINAITFLDNGNKLVAFWSSNGGREHRVTVWSWPAREPLTRFSHSCEFVYDIAASPDGKLLALPNGKNGVAVYNSASGERARVVGTAPICGLCFTAAGNMLIGGSEDGAHLHLWDSGTGAERGRISTGRSEDWLFHVDVSSDGRYLAAVTGKDILMWDLERLL